MGPPLDRIICGIFIISLKQDTVISLAPLLMLWKYAIMGIMSDKKEKIYIIDLVKAAACLMIFCYHCNSLLPGEWKWMTIFGDDMGNNLFFMVSGFALYPSVIHPEGSFPSWYFKRLKRILPMLVLFYILSFISGFYTINSPAQFITVFIYPSLYWFVTGILIFYVILYFTGKYLPLPIWLITAFALFILWFIRGGSMEAYYFLGFASMLSGFSLRDILEKAAINSRFFLPSTAALIFCIPVFIYIKLKIPDTAVSGMARFILGACVIITGVSTLISGYTKNESLSAFFNAKPRLHRFLYRVGNLALPLYLVQCFNAGMPGYLIGQKIAFPLSFAVNFAVSWGAALILDTVFKAAASPSQARTS